MHLIMIGLKVNMYSMIITNKKNEVKILEKSPSNDRMARRRPEGYLKNIAV